MTLTETTGLRYLTPEQKAHFDTLGYIVLRGVFTPQEVEYFTAAYETAFHELRGGEDFSPKWAKQRPGASGIRQQYIPFCNLDDRLLEFLDHPNMMDLVEDLLGEDAILTTAGEGFAAATDSIWHTDSRAPEGFISLKVATYFDEVDVDTGCLNIIPGGHHHDYTAEIRKALESGMWGGVKNPDIPMRRPLPSKPGDVIVFNHKMWHSSFGGQVGRRAIMMNWAQQPTERWHNTYLVGHMAGIMKQWGALYGERVIETAGERRMRKLKTALELGFK